MAAKVISRILPVVSGIYRSGWKFEFNRLHGNLPKEFNKLVMHCELRPRRSKMRMLQAYVEPAQEACSAEQPHLLIGGSFDFGKTMMDRLLCDLPFPVNILVNDAPGTNYTSAPDYALVAGDLRCFSGGRPDI